VHKGIIVTVTFIHIRELHDMNEEKRKTEHKIWQSPIYTGGSSGGGAEGDRRPHGEIF